MPAPAHDDVLAESEAFDAYEENAAKEIRRWADGDPSALSKALRLLSKPLDWAAERSATESAMKEVNERIVAVLDSLSEASTWTYDPEHVLGRARDDIDLADTASLADLRAAPMPRLDELARTFFTENTILSALEGGGTGLGGVALLAADVPILFTINLRLIQQVAASYGFRFGGPRARPLVLRVFSAAVADTPEARQEALRELRAAGKAAARGEAPGTDRDDIGVAAASSEGTDPEGTEGTDTTENQSRVLINEIARNIAAREMAQLIPLAGAATGAGLNYWFTSATAEAAYMLSRALFLEHRRLQQQQA
ncbi:MAG: EcsC family protein [Bacteroidetes bacterium SW_4_67_19]|nr:MAG: EcsC family protein [Bacteroidetes bacterium SW_4_67_19]